MTEFDQNHIVKRSALKLIAQYQIEHKPIYMSFEKNSIYNWAIQNAYESVLKSPDTPLNTLDKLLTKYDNWAHRKSVCDMGAKQCEHFSIAVSAIDDLIDVLLSN